MKVPWLINRNAEPEVLIAWQKVLVVIVWLFAEIQKPGRWEVVGVHRKLSGLLKVCSALQWVVQQMVLFKKC